MCSLSCPRKFCFEHLFAGVPEVEQMSELRVTLGRHRAVTCFDLEHVTSDVGGTGMRRSRALARSGSTRHLAGAAFSMLPRLATHSWK
jgi:hypothetical protein